MRNFTYTALTALAVVTLAGACDPDQPAEDRTPLVRQDSAPPRTEPPDLDASSDETCAQLDALGTAPSLDEYRQVADNATGELGDLLRDIAEALDVGDTDTAVVLALEVDAACQGL